ncbi:rhomboid family intramembrane serine protease [Bacillus licheniformis]|nr:rhomboid family intramembrane serine protease [Bacillus licheniformis]
MLGKLKFLIVYIGAGVIGNIGTYFIEPLEYMHVGASGAISACSACTCTSCCLERADGERQFPNHRHHPRHFGFDDVCKPNINMMAHIFGLLGGLALAPPLLNKRVNGF